ncbi:MAG TPA: hypothetical protein VMQ38_02280 [Mycobacterium sp.]|nr:hypothetical protein [Mycobacterium sp.]
MSIGKHRLGQPMRLSAISDIHVRLIGAGVIGGALSRVMNPISGWACVLGSSLTGSSIRWLPRIASASIETPGQVLTSGYPLLQTLESAPP